jgi:excisionase family DNA binding protein
MSRTERELAADIGRLLTAREVAARLGVTAETVLRWTRRGELPAFKLPGGAIRFREGELNDWLEAHRNGG